jgi:hypothetical protein
MEKLNLEVFSNGLSRDSINFFTRYGQPSLKISMFSGGQSGDYFGAVITPWSIRSLRDIKDTLLDAKLENSKSVIEELNSKITDIEKNIESEIYEAMKILLTEMDNKAKQIVTEILNKY